MIRRPHPRPGFTLLEVLLASAIAVLLLAGLYVAFDLTLTQSDVAREEAVRAGLTRAVVNRMALDLTAPVAPLPPKSGGAAGAAPTTTDASMTSGSTDTASTGTTSSTTTASTGTGTASTTSTATTGSTTTATGTTTAADGTTTDPEAAAVVNLPLHAGVIGTNTQVTLFVSRVPQAMTDPAAAANPDVVLPADLRRVTYYLGAAGGLCRQDRTWVLADGVGTTAEPDLSTEDADLIAPEVTAATFEYFDGSAWQTEWDGSLAGADGSPVGGPPRAIRATLTFEFSDRYGTTQRRIQHVFPVRAANGLFVPATATDDTTMPAATEGM